jgi:hypothetical protein
MDSAERNISLNSKLDLIDDLPAHQIGAIAKKLRKELIYNNLHLFSEVDRRRIICSETS